MRRKHGRPQDEAEVNITPMLDVVFILLIFFIVTATFVKEDGLELARPNKNEDPPPEVEDLSKTIFVQITDQNEVYIENRVIDIDAVRANIERLHAERPKAGVLISPTKDAETGTMVRVMDQARLGCPGCSVSIASGG